MSSSTSFIDAVIFLISFSATLIFYLCSSSNYLNTFSDSASLNSTYRSSLTLIIIFPSTLLPSLNTPSPHPKSTKTLPLTFFYNCTYFNVLSLNNFQFTNLLLSFNIIVCGGSMQANLYLFYP